MKRVALSPGSCIGILGGGQLGRMLAMAAAEMGYRTCVYCPEAGSPAFDVATHSIMASYTDEAALEAFASQVDVITFEFENIPLACVQFLEKITPVFPDSRVLATAQHRLREKTAVQSYGIGTANFHAVTNEAELAAGLQKVGVPAVLKTTEMGYDGKGQAKIIAAGDAVSAWHSLKMQEAILEAFVDFCMEISVIVARNSDGEIVCYPPVQNEHANHILDRTIVPAPISPALALAAEQAARTIAEGIGLIGLLAVEMFVTKDDRILVNELAPRPHNSGHWTLDAAVTSQFEQCIRAIAGWPFGSTQALCAAEMKNLIGDEVLTWPDYAKNPHAKVHLYGKNETRPGRKMGHITILKIQP